MSTLSDKPESWMWHLLGFIIPTSALVSNLVGGYWVAVPTVLALGIYPILDLISGESKPARPPRENGTPFELMLYAHAFLNPAIIIALCYRASLTGFDSVFWMAGFSTGISSGISGIIVAHEMGHSRPKSFSWWMARLNMVMAMYAHFTTEHNYNHHKTVATVEDPASAPKGRSVWTQVVLTVPQQFASAWGVERTRAQKRGKSHLSPMNPIFLGLGAEGILVAAIWYQFGMAGAMALLYQAAISIFLLEYVNYIRHYGLRREVGEKQTHMHSWQTEVRWSRWTLLELTRHPAHHLKASLPFWKLQPYEGAPTLPTGYFGMFWPSLIPPLWKRIMDPRIPE